MYGDEQDVQSPVARALLVLELIQNNPGIGGEQLARRLGVTDRAVRRHVGTLRDAGIPVEAVRGRYGGYRLGRGARLPPLRFTPVEALGLVMAVLQGHGAATGTDPIGTAVGKIIRVLPEQLAGAAEAVRGVPVADPDPLDPSPQTTAALVAACAGRQPLRLGYRPASGRQRELDVDPWAVVVWRARWYLLCWSYASEAQRVLRIDRVETFATRPGTFTPPADLDPLTALHEQLSQGWRYPIEVVIEAPVDDVRCWLAPSLGRLEALADGRTRLVASTDELDWYAEQLAAVRAPFAVIGCAELRVAVDELGRRLQRAAGTHGVDPPVAVPLT